jgi:hypothetical protein
MKFQRQVNFSHAVVDAKAARFRAEELKESLGQNVLPSVLLHHLKATLPINLALDLCSDSQVNVGFQLVLDAAITSHIDIDNFTGTNPTDIAGLPPTGWIKRCLIEHKNSLAVFQPGFFDDCGEMPGVWLMPI